jgi:hypothetical protein
VALAPPVAILFTALGPGTAGGEAVLASGGHVHSHGSPEAAIVFQPLPGGHGGHYVYKATATPHPTALGTALLLCAALFFLYGAIGHLRRRAQAAPVNLSNLDISNLERGLA